MVAAIEPLLREQLIERRQKLQNAAPVFHRPAELTQLLKEVDAALERMEMGTYGLCEVCHAPIETERLIADPLIRVCLGDLTPNERRALEEDLELAAQIQTGLLPSHTQKIDGWEVAYHYQPAGAVSGDYCDLIRAEDQSLHFVLGDVSGKGVAASMLMAHLNAMFRTLISINLPLEKMVERISRVFCESTLPTQYATLVYGRADGNGEIEICNAGHLPPLLVKGDSITSLPSTGLPIGVFSTESFTTNRVKLDKDDTLFLYTDGLSESMDGDGREYGIDRLSMFLKDNRSQAPDSIISSCRQELHTFAGGRAPSDDFTVMAIRRVH
jgi:sigma-B regulation protein RsbU (phosphoserine phosphatase)